MTPETTCPHCFRSGFVHTQRVIRGDHAAQAFRCTACEYEWELDDPPDRSEDPPERSKVSGEILE